MWGRTRDEMHLLAEARAFGAGRLRVPCGCADASVYGMRLASVRL